MLNLLPRLSPIYLSILAWIWLGSFFFWYFIPWITLGLIIWTLFIYFVIYRWWKAGSIIVELCFDIFLLSHEKFLLVSNCSLMFSRSINHFFHFFTYLHYLFKFCWLCFSNKINCYLFQLSGCTGDLMSLARSDSTGSTHSMQHGGVPELLLGLCYNATTGRLSTEVVKGSHFR